MPGKIYKEVESYCSSNNIINLLPIKQLKLYNDHMIVVESLGYDRFSSVLRDLRRQFIATFKYSIDDEDCEVVLSKIPSIVLQCKWIDKNSLLYRLNIVNDMRIEKWRSVSGPNLRWNVAEYVFDRLVELSGYKHLKEPNDE